MELDKKLLCHQCQECMLLSVLMHWWLSNLQALHMYIECVCTPLPCAPSAVGNVRTYRCKLMVTLLSSLSLTVCLGTSTSQSSHFIGNLLHSLWWCCKSSKILAQLVVQGASLAWTYLQLISHQAFTTVIAFHLPPVAGEFKVLLQFLLQDKLTTGVRTGLRFEVTIPFMCLQVKRRCVFTVDKPHRNMLTSV